MISKTPSVLVIGIAALSLLGCSKEPAPAPAAAAPAVDDEAVSEPAPAPVPVETKSEQAAKLGRYVQDKPECQQFKDAFEQVRSTNDPNADVQKIMADAYKAGCAK